MSTKKIAETLASHGSHVRYTGGVGTIVCRCGDRYGLEESYRTHVAAMLETIVREEQATAWDAAVRATEYWMLGPLDSEPTNPYRGQP